MSFVQFSQVSLAFGARDILKNVNMNLSKGSRVALTGPNGAGKSTLMKIIAGTIVPDSGDRAVQKDTRISYLPQYGIVHAGTKLIDEAEKAFLPINELFIKMEKIGHELENAKNDSSNTQMLLQTHHELQEKIEESGYYRRNEQISRILTGLGFTQNDFNRTVDEFSGGWQMRIALAKVLLESPDILLLDEPTNYLDIEAREWLQGWLTNFSGGFLIVSHDRYFLDMAVTEVYELFTGKLTRYAGNYTFYEERRAKELEQLFKAWEAQQEEIQKLEDFISRFRYNESKAALVQSRIKQLEKIIPIEIPEGMKKIHFQFPEPPHSGKIALTLTDLSKAYGEKQVINNLSLTVEAGDKIAIVGKNGAGKSTLMRIIASVDHSFTGELKYGAGIAPGYFSQDNADTLCGSGTVEQEIESIAPMELIPKVRSLLGAFLFRGDDVFKTLSVLSGGERSRVALLKILLHPSNLLILDEPTNHLDLTSKDVLLEALKEFKGTVLFVSHDRYFLEACATKVLELSPDGNKYFPGGYGYYHDCITAQENNEQEINSKLKNEKKEYSENQLSREEDKKRKGQLKKLQRREEELLLLIDQCDTKKNEANYKLSLQENYIDGNKAKLLQEELNNIEINSLKYIDEWEQVTKEIELLEK